MPRVIDCDLPDTVGRAYDEACHVELMKLPMASAVMIIRALEASLKDIDPATRSIADGLKRMKEKGVLPDEFTAWSNELRVLRNEAAHPSEREVLGTDVSEALDFLQAVLELLYHFRPKFQRFKARRGAP